MFCLMVCCGQGPRPNAYYFLIQILIQNQSLRQELMCRGAKKGELCLKEPYSPEIPLFQKFNPSKGINFEVMLGVA